MICAICQKKQAAWMQDYALAQDHKDKRICVECYEHLNNIVNGSEILKKGTFNQLF